MIETIARFVLNSVGSVAVVAIAALLVVFGTAWALQGAYVLVLFLFRMLMRKIDDALQDTSKVVPPIAKTYLDGVREAWSEYVQEETPVHVRWGQTLHDWTSFLLHDEWTRSLTLAMLVLLAYLLYRLTSSKRLKYMMSGVIGESMQPGSPIRKTEKLPSVQVPLYKPTMFGARFVGYAIRVLDYLVLPGHVYKAAEGQLAVSVQNSDEKLLIQADPLYSRSISDLMYFKLTQSVWSRIGARAVTSMPKLFEAMVTVTGPSGSSQGMLTRLQQIGCVTYAGSTQPGFSGAAYMSGNRCFGMHIGFISGTGQNLGVSLGFIMQELLYNDNPERFRAKFNEKVKKSFVSGEDSSQMSLERFRVRGNLKGWGHDQIMMSIMESVESSGWEHDPDLDYNAILDWESAPQEDDFQSDEIDEVIELLQDLSRRQRDILRSLMDSNKTKVRFHGTDDVVGEVETSKTALVGMFDQIKSLIEVQNTLADRVATLEGEFQKLREKTEKEIQEFKGLVERKDTKPMEKPVVKEGIVQNNPEKTIKCNHCNKWFKEEQFRDIHQAAVHKVTGESALVETTKVRQNKGSFLVKGLRKQRKTNFSPDSSQSESKKESTSPTVNQLNTDDLVQKLTAAFAKLLQDMHGQNSATMQN